MRHKNWSIEKGDYKRDSESTNGYEKKNKRKNIFVKIGKVLGVLLIISILAFLMTI
ncbi:MAG: hypothetical protein KJ571_18340 [Bacteroidetes bacterium]|nr:hypothetical protein [Bacteroidota bacterium]